MTEKSEMLLPCPFCGGNARTHQNQTAQALWRVICDNCDAGPHGSLSESLAVKAWNTRAAAEPIEFEFSVSTESRTSAASAEPVASELTADFTKKLPGGVLDDSTFEQIETALDIADAPCTEGSRWLTLPERIAALAAAAKEVSGHE